MQIRLISLVLACGALILAISSCGGDSTDFKPPNKTGALDSGAPDVILFVLEGEAAEIYGEVIPKGVSFGATYARFTQPEFALADLYRLGRPDAGRFGGTVDFEVSPLFDAFVDGGYTATALSLSDLGEFLVAESTTPRFAVVKTRSLLDWEMKADFKPLLTVWTVLPRKEQAETLTEENLHVPLVFSMPGTLPENQVHTQVVSLADVGVTILDLCGLLPEGTERNDNEGSSFARILQKKPLVWRGFVLAKTPSGAGWIRSTRWRLVRQADGTETITYIEKNPTSTSDDRNLAGAAAQVEGLGGRLDTWLK